MDLTQLPELPEFIRRKAEQAIEDATTLQGMRTNGPAYARIEASHLAALLRYAQAPRAALPEPDDARDAARYRFLRTLDDADMDDELSMLAYLPLGDELDVLIDAEMLRRTP